MTKWTLARVSTILLLFCGCAGRTEYEIELTPQGQELERKLTVTRGSTVPAGWGLVEVSDPTSGETRSPDTAPETGLTKVPPEEFARIAKAYGKEPPTEPVESYSVSGRFIGTMPNDVGGRGSYTYFETSMGKAYIYVERFRGNDDLHGQVELRTQSVDKLVDLLIGWFEAEMNPKLRWERLRSFMQTQFRKDVKNLSLYLWCDDLLSGWARGRWEEAEDRPPIRSETIIRICQYFHERGYLKQKDLPGLSRRIDKMFGHGEPDVLLKVFQRLIARGMGVADHEPIPRSLSFLKDQQAMEKSLIAYLRTTNEYKARMADWHQERKKDPTAAEPTAELIIAELAQAAFLWGILWERVPFLCHDVVKVSLGLSGGAVYTNGIWDPETERIRWTRLMVPASELPALCYAIWAGPEVEFQKRHFGKVVLKDEGLFRYCLWYKALTLQESKEWDQFVSSLRPGPTLAEKLDTFRFSHEPTQPKPGEDCPPESDATGVLQEILTALEPTTQPTRPAK